MKIRSLLSLMCLAGILVVGCQTKDSENAPSGGDTNASGNTPTAEAPKDLEVPKELMSDAYEYYGLSRREPIKMKVTANGTESAATQTVSISAVEKDHVLFLLKNEGGLQQLGDVTAKLDKEGVKIIAMNGAKLEKESMELPVGLTPGKKWPFILPTPNLKLSGTNTVTGTSKVTTSVGTYNDAILVTSSASGEQNGKKVQLTSKQWLVKGRGQVKAEITSTEGGKKSTVVMEETK
ncbi:MAG TPA: hypothetical protein VK171_14075 [Fimbriimonas sp.]|nr:hypothetical protein [Fimbriimonas sp.]